MHSFRTDSQFFRDALERVGKADDLRSPVPIGPERRETGQISGKRLPFEQRELAPTRVIGRLVALNGTQGVISCLLKLDEEQWSVGHLITIGRGKRDWWALFAKLRPMTAGGLKTRPTPPESQLS
jgi:hypothetical protein